MSPPHRCNPWGQCYITVRLLRRGALPHGNRSRSARRVLAMTEREEAIALIAAGIRKLGELSKAIATISTAARLIAEDLDAVERALIVVGSYLREGRPEEESDPAMLLRLCQRHIRSLVASIDRMNELNATAELRVVAQELARLGFRASPHEPTGN